MPEQPTTSLLRRLRSFAAARFPVLRRLSGLEHRLRVMGKPTAQVFEEIYDKTLWGNDDSVSGQGSSLAQTEAVRAALPGLLRELGCRSMLDIPCGDFHWMSTIDLDIDYTGGDIVAALVAKDEEKFGSARRRFVRLDLTTDALPAVDLVLCRDCLPHLAVAQVKKALANLQRSGATYLLTTTFDGRTKNTDIPTGMFRPINLELPPFSLGKPVRVIDERCPTPGFGDKRLALWRIGSWLAD
jgi:hypothetical protein